jgi:hypothetical protein
MLTQLNFSETPTQTLKDAKVFHLSTWMIVKDPALRQILASVTGEDIHPIRLKIRHFGNEDSLHVYNNLTLEDLIARISTITQLDTK